jgi:triacylglycerol lipase
MAVRFASFFALLVALGSGCACGSPSGPLDGGDAQPTEDASVDAVALTDAPPDALSRDAPSDVRPDAPRDAPRLGPPYPVVLAHGFFGFDDFAGIGFIQYFYGVEADLRDSGERHVYITEVDPFADSTTRGNQLLAQVEAILEETGYARVNLIGHSQGGLDARVVASLRPDLIASVTTVATPHRGTVVSDVLLRIVADDRLRDLIDAFVRVIGAPLYDAAGDETSVFAAIEQFSSEGIAVFNDMYPNVPTIPYFSIAGRSASAIVRGACLRAESPDFIDRWNIYLDPLDPLFSIPGAIVAERLIGSEVHDGLVAADSAAWGRFLGCIPADHMDEVGHLVGDSPGFGNGFDHLAFYRDLVAFLRSEGL